MNYSELLRLSVKDIEDDVLMGGSALSDAFYNTYRDLQQATKCSYGKFTITPSLSGQVRVSLNDLQFSLSQEDFGYDGNNNPAVSVSPIYIHAIYDATDSSNPVRVYTGDKVAFDEDVYSDEIITVNFENSGMVMTSKSDMYGNTYLVNARYVVKYREDSFAEQVIVDGSLVDYREMYLNMIPDQFRSFLPAGVKYHLFKSMFDKTGRKDFATRMDRYEQLWVREYIPFVQQEVLGDITPDVVYRAKPKRLISTVYADNTRR